MRKPSISILVDWDHKQSLPQAMSLFAANECAASSTSKDHAWSAGIMNAAWSDLVKTGILESTAAEAELVQSVLKMNINLLRSRRMQKTSSVAPQWSGLSNPLQIKDLTE